MSSTTNTNHEDEHLNQEEKYLIHQSPEISVGGNTIWARHFKAFPALQSRNYRIYFSGQFVSLIGSWLQTVAQGWLVLQLTGSAILVGLVAAMATLPTTLFTLFGGVVVDRFPKKKILYFTQGSNMVLALILGSLTVAGQATATLIATFAFLMGTVNALDAPARQALVPELVQKHQLRSAIALNSGIFNAARVIGPGVAGILIALVGTGGAFIINGLSYIAVLFALSRVVFHERPAARALRPLRAIREGVTYSLAHPVIRILLLFIGVVSIFGWSYMTIMPVIAQDMFGQGASGLGYLYPAMGLGALLATYLVGAHGDRLPPVLFMIGGNTLFSVSLILFSFTRSFPVGLALMFLIGLGLLSQSSMMNTTIQGMVRNEFRGRVMSMYILMFTGMAPLGNYEVGWLTEHLGITWALSLNAAVVLVFGFVVLYYRPRILEAYRRYRKDAPYSV